MQNFNVDKNILKSHYVHKEENDYLNQTIREK